MEFLTLDYLYAVLIISAAGVVHGFTGFASGLIIVPLLTLLWGPLQAITIMVGLTFLASLQITVAALPMTKESLLRHLRYCWPLKGMALN